MLAVLEASVSDINLQITNSLIRSRNTPAPVPPDSNSKRFWRVRVDAGIDTDHDGNPDWAELEIAARGTGMLVAGVIGNPFDADTNHDGIPDGQQLDADLDSTPDANDPDAADNTVTFPIGPIPRYALFPITNAQPQLWMYPFQISDRGTVLYRNGTWAGGAWTELDMPEEELDWSGYGARAINDHDVILGISTLSKSDEKWGYEEQGYCFWETPAAALSFVTTGAGDNQVYAAVADNLSDNFFWHHPIPGPILSNDGHFTAFTWGKDLNHYQHIYRILRPSYWKLPSAGAAATEEESDHRLYHSQAPSLRWGGRYPLYGDEWEDNPWELNAIQPHTRLIYAPNLLPELSFTPMNLSIQPGGAILAMAESYANEQSQVLIQGVWKPSGIYGQAFDIAADGTAIGRNHGGLTAPICLNGKWTDITRTTPVQTDVFAPPTPWHDATLALLDTTPGGWNLARRGTYPEEYAVMLPIRAEGYYAGSNNTPLTEAVGVDDFSIGSETPGNAVRERIWIMAPQGGFNKIVKLKAPLNSNTPLNLSASNILFNGQESATVSAAVNAVTLRVADTVSSGGERLMTVTMGSGDNEVSSVSQPIGLKIMKGRTVNVTVYKVTIPSPMKSAMYSSEKVTRTARKRTVLAKHRYPEPPTPAA